MRHVERLLVALVATVAVALTSAMGITLWRLWRDPPKLILEGTSDGLRWRGTGLSAELTFADGGFEQLVVWRDGPNKLFD